MAFAFRCPRTGLPYMFDEGGQQVCPSCGEKHDTYPTGGPARSSGAPAVFPDRMTPHMDWGAGCMIDSKSQERRIYAQKGLRSKSVAEHRRQYGGFEKRMGGISYAGQGSRTSSDERGRNEVRTGTGQRVV